MEAIRTKIEGDYKYDVFYDPDAFEVLNDMDYESEQKKQAFLSRFERYEIGVYGVVVSKRCECCGLWPQLEGLWGIIEETAEDALKCYMKEHKQEC